MFQFSKLRESQQTQDNRYKDILVTILAVTILPILVINAIFYFYNIRRFEQSYLDVRISQLKQSATSAKEIIRHIDVIMNILGENEDIIDFIINPGDSDYKHLADIHKFLNGFIISGQSIRSIYIYSKTSGLVISSDSGLHKIQDFFDTDWIDDFDTHFLGRENLDTRRVIINNKEFHFISFMRNLPLGSWSKTGGIIINLNEDLFYEDTFPSEHNLSGGFVINSDGRIVSHNDKNLLGQFYWNELKSKESGGTGLLSRRNKTIPCYIKDDFSKWGFVLEIDISDVFNSFRTYLLITLLIFFTVILIIVVLDIRLSKQFYQPVKLLGDVKKEFEYAKPLIEGKILNNIIQNRYSSEQGIASDLNLIDMNFFDSSSVILLIAIDRYEELIDKEEYQSLAMLKLSLQHFLYRILDESPFLYLYSETKRDQICLLINLQSSSLIEQQEKLISLAETIVGQTAEEFPFTVTIGIGDVYKKLMNLHLSYQEARDAVRYKLIHGQSQVIKYADVKKEGTRTYSFKSPYEKQILQSIQLGLGDDVEAQVHNLCHDLRQSESYDINFMKYTLNRIVHDLLERYRREIEDSGTLLREFDRLETLEDIEAWMVRNSRAFALANGSKKTSENQAAARKIGEYINRNIANKNISLVDIGDALGLTPSYISRIFKESYGYNYLEYLNRSRIDKAKELLAASELSIAEIGDSVGFSSTQSFLRVFQRYEKTSPGKYRKGLTESI